MRKLIGYGLLAAGVLVLPLAASALTLFDILAEVNTGINIVTYLLIGVAVLAFFFGLVSYLFRAGEEKSKGLNIMIWGVVAIFVMVSIWGLVRLLQTTFGVTSTQPIVPQTIQINSAGTI